MSNELETTKQQEIAIRLNESVLSVLGAENVKGFERAFNMANAVAFLKENLTDEIMKPIMALQGSKLGFKVDKPYPVSVVRDCLIDAALTGVEPTGNQFNIIGNNFYITKEGFGALLGKVKGLRYSIKHKVPTIDSSKTFATVESTVKWSYNGEEHTEQITHSIKGSAYASSDAYLGKAERKVRAWLFNQVSDIEVSDGDVEDIEATVISSKPNASKPTTEDIELLRFKEFLSAKVGEDLVHNITLEDVENIESFQKEINVIANKKELLAFAKSRQYSEIEKALLSIRNEELKEESKSA